MGAVPRPDSLENSARFMPNMKAAPNEAPVNAPTPSVAENALVKMSFIKSGRALACCKITYSPAIT